MARPTAIHEAPIPAAYTAPGSPRNSQPDISLAPADSAASGALSRRPPSAKSENVTVS